MRRCPEAGAAGLPLDCSSSCCRCRPLGLGKLKEALAKSEKPERKQQAAGWKIFKSPDPAGANVLYIFIIDPSVKGADYQVSNIIAEAFPAEANDLLKKYADSYAQPMNILNMNVIQNLGK